MTSWHRTQKFTNIFLRSIRLGNCMFGPERTSERVQRFLFLMIGVFLLAFGPAILFSMPQSSNTSNGVPTQMPQISYLSPEVAMGFAIFVSGLMSITKGYSRIFNSKPNLGNVPAQNAIWEQDRTTSAVLLGKFLLPPLKKSLHKKVLQVVF